MDTATVDLPLLALEAANELDEMIEGRGIGLVSVRKLAAILKTAFQSKEAVPAQNIFVDSLSIAVVSYAIDETEGKKPTTVSELISQALSVANILENTDSTKDESLRRMRDFCMALSKASSAINQSIYEMPPTHPFRS